MMKGKMNKVLLVSMPWAYAWEPSLAIGLLKSVFIQNEIQCDVLDVAMRLLRWINIDTYDVFSTTPSFGVNDFLFSYEFEPNITTSQLSILKRICQDDFGLVENYYKKLVPPEMEMDTLVQLRQSIIPQMLDELVNELDLEQYAFVGFTCQYDQIWSSLALAHKIKNKYPSVTIVFGGASVDNPVGEYLQSKFSEIDIVTYGDGEPIVVPLFHAICRDIELKNVPNISYRDPQGRIIKSSVRCDYDIQNSPVPDYDAWFKQAAQLKEGRGIDLQLAEVPVESSRGCWWGQKSHCQFCGTEKSRHRYRCKPAATVIKQLDTLYNKHGIKTFRFNENIMPKSYTKDFWPVLAERGAPYKIHYEIKSNQSAMDIGLYARGGAFFMQPGIESFSTPVLKRMKKGVTGIQNIFTIYTLMEHDIYCFYNIIFGMPGDQIKEYQEMHKIIPCLYHLIPPGGLTWPFVQRHSPLAERLSALHSEEGLDAYWRFHVMFSPSYLQENGLELKHCVHYFNNPNNGVCEELKQAYRCLQHQIIHWHKMYYKQESQLSYVIHKDCIRFSDTRFKMQKDVMEFDAVHAWVYMALKGEVSTRSAIYETLKKKGVRKLQVDEILEELCLARIVLQEEDRFIGLAFEEKYYKKPKWWTINDAVRNIRR